jgi:hypothetical protein
MQAVKKYLSEEVTIGVHVNIAAYAPFHLVAQFLYHFLVFGILWDEPIGEMLALPPNIKWLVSNIGCVIELAIISFMFAKIFIEIGQTSTHDTQFLHRSTNAVLSALPIVQHVATLVPHERYFQKFPQASHEAQVCYAFTLQFIKDKLNLPVSSLPLLEAARQTNDAINILNMPDSIPCNWNTIHELLGGRKVKIPSQNILWNIFFSVLKDKCEWLKIYSKFILLFLFLFSI